MSCYQDGAFIASPFRSMPTSEDGRETCNLRPFYCGAVSKRDIQGLKVGIPNLLVTIQQKSFTVQTALAMIARDSLPF